MKIGAFRILLLLLACWVVMLPLLCQAGSVPGILAPKAAAPAPSLPNKGGPTVTIPGFYGGEKVESPLPNTLPRLKDPYATIPGVSVDGHSSDNPNTMTIRQSREKVIINWASFDIGADATVEFKQGNSSWTALNRIWDRDPSYIFGTLRADGKIYLINQNGILFGPGSKVNVNSLTASALNIKDDDFINNALNFKLLDYQDPVRNNPYPLAAVSNHGEINAADGGYVFLMAPRVENAGLISTPTGQIGLVAGTDVTLKTPSGNDTTRSGFYVIVDPSDFNNPPPGTDPTFGKAVNQEGGALHADGGMVGMYGNTVDQWGIIRSMTAFRNNKGQVELRAANKVTTGVNSIISLPVNPSTTDTVSDTFDIQPRVDIKGLFIYDAGQKTIKDQTAAAQIELRGIIQAPTGNVSLMAGNRVYMEAGSLIDVSGVDATLPAPVIKDFKFTSVELRDAYPQKGGIVPGMKITTSVMAGSAFGDLAQVILGTDRTALERSIGGAKRKTIKNDGAGHSLYSYDDQNGNIQIEVANGDIIVKQDAALSFSGGLIHYTGGFFDTTKLVSGTRIYDISNAPLYLVYDRIIGQYEKKYERFGVKESWSGLYYGGSSPLRTFMPDYTRGGDAGTLTLRAAAIVLDGRLNGSVTRGTYQNVWTMKGSFASEYDYNVAKALSAASGREAPHAGTLTIGGNPAMVNVPFYSFATDSISILSDASPQAQLNPDSPLQTGQGHPTVLSAKSLNDANLSTLNLYALQTISTAPDARIGLQPGGVFSASARRIEHQGEVKVPAGSISMVIEQKTTSYGGTAGNYGDGKYDGPNPNYVKLDERIILGPGSRLDASGERIDNTLAGKTSNAPLSFGLTGGGSINIQDKTDQGSGVFIQAGSVVDVSGGYSIDQKGKATGGHAGIVSIQGSNIVLDGDLRGHALADPNGKILGGSITLASKEIHVFDHTSPVKDPIAGAFYLADNRFDDTGFTQIALKSVNDIVIEPNTTIATSRVRLNNPTPARQAAAGSAVTGPDLIRLDNDDSTALAAGPSSFTAAAGISFEGNGANYTDNLKIVSKDESKAKITISPGAAVRTAPAVSSVTRIASDVGYNPGSVKTNISLDAPLVEVAGTLKSPGGNIAVKATNGSLQVKSGAKILAMGYKRPDPASTPKGFAMNSLPVNGGSVSLSAGSSAIIGDLTLEQGSRIDVSGPEAVTNRMRSADGSIITFQDAGTPGSLSLSYSGKLTWAGDVNAQAQMAGIKGGALAVSRTNMNSGDSGMDVYAADIAHYLGSGFDDLTLRSKSFLNFNGNMDVTIGRKLTLDAPEIRGAGQNVTLSAPWIILTNSYDFSTQQPVITTPGKQLALSGQWIDVIGTTQFSGFQVVRLDAARDIRLSQALYIKDDDSKHLNGGNTLPNGKLITAGDLILDADRIYPGNYYQYKNASAAIYPDIYSDYTLHAGGKVTIQNTHTPVGGTIYSAGGSLTVEAGGGIEVKKGGFLAAPLGAIKLTTAVDGKPPAPGSRIYLADGGVLTTADTAAINGNIAINYGLIDSSNLWVTQDKTNPGGAEAASSSLFNKDLMPQKGVTLDADETIVMKGSLIDVSGGGSVFAYKFQPGVEGSSDPLTKPGRYIVFKDNAFQQPGTAVYLKGGGGLSEGQYTLLPIDANNPQNARYAFMPGAYIIELQSGAPLPGSGQQALSKDGYPLTIGYSAAADTPIRGTRPQVYSVRNAADVLAREGHYLKPEPLVSGDAGNLTLKGSTTIIEGAFKAGPLDSTYMGGKIFLSGKNVIVRPAAADPLPSWFDSSAIIDNLPDPAKYKNKLVVSSDSFSGFREVGLGLYTDPMTNQDVLVADTVTIKNGSVLTAAIISLGANNLITVESGAKLDAKTTKTKESGEGVISLNTPGSLDVQSNATLHAKHAISLNVNDVQGIAGDLWVENSTLKLKSRAIFFDPNPRDPGDKNAPTGLYLTQSKWNMLGNQFEDITLAAGYTGADNKYVSTEIRFKDSFDLWAKESLTLDAARIVNQGSKNVSLSAPTVNLKNTGGASPVKAQAGTGNFAVKDAMQNDKQINVNQINIGGGDVLFGGFEAIALNSHGDVTLMGKGSLTTGNAALNINAARVTTAGVARTVKNSNDGKRTTTTPIIPANFTVYTGANYNVDQNKLNPQASITITNTNSDGAPGATSAPGGILELWGTEIKHQGGIIQVDAGTIKLVAASGDISPGSSARILAKGTADAPGGQVTLQADNGKITMAGTIDVSAGDQGDAGKVSLLAPNGDVTISGVLSGKAIDKKDSQGKIVRKGRGGSFVLNTRLINDFSGLNYILKNGGFNESLDIRARTGNINIARDQNVTAHHIKLTADDSGKDTNGNLLGQINVYGTIDASADSAYTDGGTVELYANNDLNILGQILANGNGGKGGYVLLSSANGWVNVNAKKIDVSGASSATDGISSRTVYLRAPRNWNDVNINLNDSITGASAVYAETVKMYDLSKWQDFSTLLNDAQKGALKEASDFYDNASGAVNARLAPAAPGGASTFHLLPGIEVDIPNTFYSGDVTLSSQLDLTNKVYEYDNNWKPIYAKYGSANDPGVLTIRAAGNLNIGSNLVDHPTDMNNLVASPVRNSWGFNLVAGADMSSANYMSVNTLGTGNLNIADQMVVYTESAPIRFAAGGDTLVGSQAKPGYMIKSSIGYNLATYSGPIQGYVGRDLSIAGAVQTATGPIDINVGRDINLVQSNSTTLGAIRTTGEPPSDHPLPGDSTPSTYDPATPYQYNRTKDYWRYAGGGDITLDVGRYTGTQDGSGKWMTAQSPAMWDAFTPLSYRVSYTLPGGRKRWKSVIYDLQFSANFGDDYGVVAAGTAGFATMGGGNLFIRTGGDFLSQAGTFGDGNLTIYAGGDIRGRFLNRNGQGELHAMGNFGSADERQQIELFKSNFAVTALGEVQIGAVLNPSLASDKVGPYRISPYYLVNCDYTPETKITLKAGSDVTIAGKSPSYTKNSNPAATSQSALLYETIMPATVNIDAGGNIFLLNDLTLASSPIGNLRLVAERGDIRTYLDASNKVVPATILMSDIAPDYWYGHFKTFRTTDGTTDTGGDWIKNRTDVTAHHHGFFKPEDADKQAIAPAVHKDDPQRIEISAGGNITDLTFQLPKQAVVKAGVDIRDIIYEGQNINPGDVSMIRAGGNISMKYAKAVSGGAQTDTDEQPHNGLIQGGPGVFLVQAGGSIDLGSLKDGIQTVGNGSNPALGTGKSTLVVLSGYTFDKKAEDISAFFTTIRNAGDEYSTLMAAGKLADGADLLQKTRTETIYSFLGKQSAASDITMTSSQIGTSIGQSDIFVIAAGSLNLGKTALPSSDKPSATTGIWTGEGGGINVFTVKDVNVNESRIMTFDGGDITIWSDQGSINAGRGSRTAVSAQSPKWVDTPGGGRAKVYTPPASGSGIRATHPTDKDLAGNIHLFAPSGIIDAGEAGISGGKVVLVATQVLNAANISFSAGSIGVPQAAASTAGIGALSGAGSVTTGAGQMASEASGAVAAERTAQAAKMIEDIMMKWLEVKVIDFVQDEN